MNASQVTASTDISSRSTSLAIAMEQALILEERLEQEASASPTDVALQRMLSLRSVISTASSFAERQQAAVGRSVEFGEIGKGSIGVIFEHPGTIQCYKLPLLDNSDKLWNNYTIHTKVQEAFRKASNEINVDLKIPKMFWFANKTTSNFWDENLDRFPFSDTFPRKTRDVLCMERVLPLQQPLRHHLIDKYCPRDQEAAKSYAPNRDCLVRPLLGRRRRGSGSVAFSLRNFRLHLDQFQELNLNVDEYAIAMADAMAVLHCVANIDAMDIEFVIGSAPSDMQTSGNSLTSADLERMRPGQSTFEMVTGKDFTRRILCLWVLDFDACKPIKLDPVGAQAAVKAFMETEPYCPRPSQNDEAHKLWRSFGQRYVQTCAKFEAHPKFPVAFLNGVEAEVKAARAGQNTTPVSSQVSRSSTEASSRGRTRSYGQLGHGRSGSQKDRQDSRDMNANWRK